jgi:NAD(P)-dependent dehydrogenase (short-subunit alcohol dehydrogenase family)
LNVVVITGASRGIGEATALHLDAMGLRVFAGVRSEADAQRLRQRSSGRMTPLMLDVASESSIALAVEGVRAAGPFARLALINNAAVSAPGPLEFMPLAEVRRQFEVNFFGALAVIQGFLPVIREARDGRIVNVSSVNGRQAWRYIGPYTASKFALEGLSDTLRMELRRWGIRVSVIEPGAVSTPIFQASRERGRQVAAHLPARAHELYGSVLKAIAGRPGTAPKHAMPPERVASVIARAVTARSPRTRYVVGWDAGLTVTLARLLPDSVVDWLLLRLY